MPWTWLNKRQKLRYKNQMFQRQFIREIPSQVFDFSYAKKFIKVYSYFINVSITFVI